MPAYTDRMVGSTITRSLEALFETNSRGIVAAYLFGSVARETAGPGSDIDIGLLFAADPAPTLEGQPFDLADALERYLGRPVDVVVLNTAPADLRMRVLRDGRLVFEGDAAARVRFEVATRNEAFDLEPILREYRRPRTSA